MKLTRRLDIGFGYETVIDARDYSLICDRNWRVYRTKKSRMLYALSCGMVKGKRKWGQKCTPVFLHRFLFKASKNELVDHKDRDGLNNRRRNLRKCSRVQNAANSETPKSNTSGYKGVHWNKNAKKWSAQIRVNYTQTHLGYFTSPEDAALAYDIAAKKAFGEFAYLNNV